VKEPKTATVLLTYYYYYYYYSQNLNDTITKKDSVPAMTT